MRISTAWAQRQSVTNMLDRQADLSRTQRQFATGKRILAPSDDPIGATQVLGLNKTLARTAQYQRNIGAATDRLQQEEHVLSSVGKLLQNVRQLALQANNATQTNETRADIAVEVRQRIDQLVQIANTRDGRGEYIFSGYSTDTRPFTKAAGGVVYQGDQGQRVFQVGASQRIAAGDNGEDVFERIATGNGTFAVSPDAANTGSGIVGATAVTDPTAYDDDTYSVTFTAPNTYEVRDSDNTLVTSGAYTKNQSIGFKGIQFTLDGEPAVGDSFEASPSTNQSLFGTLENLAAALERPTGDPASNARLHNAINAALNGIDNGMGKTLDVRARVGARLKNLEDRGITNGDYSLQLKDRRSKIQDVDYAAAASRLTLQSTMLKAAQKAFIKVQGLSLFNYMR